MIDDYLRLTKYLTSQELPFQTYQLPEEKILKIVLRSLPTTIPEEHILEEMRLRNLPALKTRRMKIGRERCPCPLVMVELDRTPAGKQIFNINDLLREDPGGEVQAKQHHRPMPPMPRVPVLGEIGIGYHRCQFHPGMPIHKGNRSRQMR